ncbi:NUDIX hydrolase [Paenibacillus dakarensis]|uniref:NUDIX hydrolase n=1 Tax=Paenibacillus dakarensis TaxID=1527293 RepID=UPI0006D59DAF|nr:NUDIX hydrolase [Paenibacillus dakarensis]
MSSKLIGAASIIFDSEERILLVKHSYGRNNWDLPGGKAELNESAEETAAREALEEIGVQITVGEISGIYYDPIYDMHHFVFLARIEQGLIPTPSSPEILECGFFSIHDLPKPMSDFTYNRILDALNNNRKKQFHEIGPRKWIE